MNRIITIGREFGSGGRELGRRLSEALGIAYYDQEIVSEIARRTEMSEQYVQSIVENRPSFSFPIHIGRSFCPMPSPAIPGSTSTGRTALSPVKWGFSCPAVRMPPPQGSTSTPC